MNIYRTNPYKAILNEFLIDSPAPIHINYFYNLGALLGKNLVILKITGIFLAKHYNPSVESLLLVIQIKFITLFMSYLSYSAFNSHYFGYLKIKFSFKYSLFSIFTSIFIFFLFVIIIITIFQYLSNNSYKFGGLALSPSDKVIFLNYINNYWLMAYWEFRPFQYVVEFKKKVSLVLFIILHNINNIIAIYPILLKYSFKEWMYEILLFLGLSMLYSLFSLTVVHASAYDPDWDMEAISNGLDLDSDSDLFDEACKPSSLATKWDYLDGKRFYPDSMSTPRPGVSYKDYRRDLSAIWWNVPNTNWDALFNGLNYPCAEAQGPFNNEATNNILRIMNGGIKEPINGDFLNLLIGDIMYHNNLWGHFPDYINPNIDINIKVMAVDNAKSNNDQAAFIGQLAHHAVGKELNAIDVEGKSVFNTVLQTYEFRTKEAPFHTPIDNSLMIERIDSKVIEHIQSTFSAKDSELRAINIFRDQNSIFRPGGFTLDSCASRWANIYRGNR